MSFNSSPNITYHPYNKKVQQTIESQQTQIRPLEENHHGQMEKPNTSSFAATKKACNHRRKQFQDRMSGNKQQQQQQKDGRDSTMTNVSGTENMKSDGFLNPYESFENYHRQQSLLNENNRIIKTEQTNDGETNNLQKQEQ